MVTVSDSGCGTLSEKEEEGGREAAMRGLLVLLLTHCVVGSFYFDVPSLYPSVLAHSNKDSGLEEPNTPSKSPTEFVPTSDGKEQSSVTPTADPSATSTLKDTQRPSVFPTIAETEKPTPVPTIENTKNPTTFPSVTEEPSAEPTRLVTDKPSPVPSLSPTDEITTEIPSAEPTAMTAEPTPEPSFKPSLEPTISGGEYAYGDDNGENTATEFTDILSALFNQLDEKSIAFLSGVVITLILIFVVVRRYRRPITASESYSRLPTTDIELVPPSQGDDTKWDDWDNDVTPGSATAKRGALSLTKSAGVGGSNHSISSVGSNNSSGVLNGKDFRITPFKGHTPEGGNSPLENAAGSTPKAAVSNTGNNSSNSIKSLSGITTKISAVSPKPAVDEDLFETIGIAAKPKFLTPIPPPPVASTQRFSPFQVRNEASNTSKKTTLIDIEADADGGTGWDDLDELVP